MDTLVAQPDLYGLLAGLLVLGLVEAQKRWSLVPWVNLSSTKLRKALTAACTSILAASIPPLAHWATSGTPPDWEALGGAARAALLTFLVASGLWAALLHRSASAERPPP